jgi:hypothetical protein
MPLELVVEKLDVVPEALRSLYVEADGKYKLDVNGVEDVSGLKKSIAKERDAAQAAINRAKELEKQFEGIDPVKTRELYSRLENDEEAKLIAAGKTNEVFEKRTERLRTEHQKVLDAEAAKAKQAEERVKAMSLRVIDNHIRAAAAKAGIHPQAIEDALYRGRSIFALDESDNAVQLDEGGKPIMGKDGKTPFSPLEWLESMKQEAPHWFPATSSGGGATGNSGRNNTGTKQIKRAAFDALSHLERAQHMKDGFKIVD